MFVLIKFGFKGCIEEDGVVDGFVICYLEFFFMFAIFDKKSLCWLLRFIFIFRFRCGVRVLRIYVYTFISRGVCSTLAFFCRFSRFRGGYGFVGFCCFFRLVLFFRVVSGS